MCSDSEAGSYLRLVDSCITQLKAHGPSRTCNESKEEEEDGAQGVDRHYMYDEYRFLDLRGRLVPNADAPSEGESTRLLGPVDPSFRALSERLKFTVRRHRFNKDSLHIIAARGCRHGCANLKSVPHAALYQLLSY